MSQTQYTWLRLNKTRPAFQREPPHLQKNNFKPGEIMFAIEFVSIEFFSGKSVLEILLVPLKFLGMPYMNNCVTIALLAAIKNTIILFVFPPRFCKSIVSSFSWDHWKSQQKIKTMLMQNFGGQTKSRSILVALIVANCFDLNEQQS